MPVALVTGASRGLGRALALALSRAGWSLVIDARDAAALARTADELRAAGAAALVAAPGDVSDPGHRADLVTAVEQLGSLDLVVNNASMLGPSPQPRLADYQLETMRRVYDVNTLAPWALTAALLPMLRASRGRLVNISSDAAVEAYAGWGGYGSSKAALDQWSAILGAEEPAVRVYAFDPGDMRTQMHQDAFPDEDISDRPLPETVVPELVHLVSGDLPSGRYRATVLRGRALGATA